MLVRIVRSWPWPDLRRQTPGSSMRWQDIRFTEDPVEECDHVVVLNRCPAPARVRCSPDRIWAVMQEPPPDPMHRGLPCYARIFSADARRRTRRHVPSQPALPWHVDRTYDELRHAPVPDKPRLLSWVTSAKRSRPGHEWRLAFLDRLRRTVDFDLLGRGFRPIEDKWDGIAPYRYSLAVENSSGPHYWTEKLADCFLGWTMPIYFGCTNLADYFPPQSYVPVDMRDPDAPERVRETIAGDLWRRHRDAIAEARARVLERYQLFPFLAGEIERLLARNGRRLRPPRPVTIDVWRPGRLARLRRWLGRRP
jgi:hypothetical protein